MPPARAAFERALNARYELQGTSDEEGRVAAGLPQGDGMPTAVEPLKRGKLSAEMIARRASRAYALLRQSVQPLYALNDERECRAKDPATCRVHGVPESDDREPWEKRQEEREHLEELLAEMDRQEEAAADAEAMRASGYTEEEARRIYDEQKARDRWSSMTRQGDPQTREDIEKRLAELDAEDAAENARGGEQKEVAVNFNPNHDNSNGQFTSGKSRGGRNKEHSSKSESQKTYKVNQNLPMNKQVRELANALEKSLKPGSRYESIIERPEFGGLIISCGSSAKNGSSHVFLPRHKITATQVARTLLEGKITPHKEMPSRLEVRWDRFLVVLEREIKKGSGRISKTKAKLHTAYDEKNGQQ